MTGWQGVIVDISDVRLAEEAAARSEARYRNLVEHLPAVVYVDSPDVEPLSLYVSPSSTEILGYAPIEYLNDPSLWMRTIHPDDVGMVAVSWTAAVLDGSAFAEEYRFVLGTLLGIRRRGSGGLAHPARHAGDPPVQLGVHEPQVATPPGYTPAELGSDPVAGSRWCTPTTSLRESQRWNGRGPPASLGRSSTASSGATY